MPFFGFGKPKLPKELIILPRIKHTNFVKATEQISGIKHADKPIVESLVGDLLLTYSVDMGDTFTSVSQGFLAEHKLSMTDMRMNAYGRGLLALQTMEVTSDGTLFQVSAADNMAACCLVYPEFWEHIEKEVGSSLVAIFPHRDVVFFGAFNNPEVVPNLKELLSQVDEDNHNLSKKLYLRHKKSSQAPIDLGLKWAHEIDCWKVI
jgi:uncharacterized protein YtpQ (UPF0354 family)